MTNNHLPIAPSWVAADLFSEEQWRQVQALLTRLDDRQSLWLSGYLAARQRLSQAPESASSGAERVYLSFGSETGNCETLAYRLGEQLSQQNIASEVMSLAEVKPRALSRMKHLIVICSTHGDGDPPEPAATFYETLMSEQAPKLTDTQFAVLALGDSSYAHFCTAGKRIDERLAQLGGRRLIARCDCDVDFELPAKQWATRVTEALARLQQGQPATLERVSTPLSISEAASRHNPLLVEVLENVRLTGEKREKAIHHLELLIEPGRLAISPGDAIGILPHNPPELVAAILKCGGFLGAEPVAVSQRTLPLTEALREHLDVSIPSTAFLKCWADASKSAPLQELVNAENRVQRQFLRSVQVLDILRAYPGAVEAQIFADNLRPLQPRLYDVANEVTSNTDELHLTVKDFRYALNEREFLGTASRYLLRLRAGDCVRIYPHPNKRFRLPDHKDALLIFIANGTGIAPFRAFFQYIDRQKSPQTCWLIFQEASAEEDFLYQLDLQQAAARGALRYTDTLFSLDQPHRRLSDILLDRVDRLTDWLARGAHLYLCGEKEVLGHCERDIQLLCEKAGHGHLWKQVIDHKRFHRNLY